jgi:hypothetical protein
VAFGDDIQLMLKILGHDADMMLEHFLYFFEVISIHGTSLHLTCTPSFNAHFTL